MRGEESVTYQSGAVSFTYDSWDNLTQM
jgi:hypothetical protein